MTARLGVRAALLTLLTLLPLSTPAEDTIGDRLARGEVDALRAEMADPQQAAVLNTFLGRADLNADFKGLPAAIGSCARPGINARGAVSWLDSRARDVRVLMFNESHSGPQSRAFVLQMLPGLKRLGFTHIGFETLRNLNRAPRRYTPADGYYTHEPVFTGLLRAANSAGFTVFAYETNVLTPETLSMKVRIAARELDEARNLAAQIAAAPRTARFVVFAGWSHIAEEPLSGVDPKGDRWMANRFKELSGIDPLTIDLTTCTVENKTSEAGAARVFIRADGTVQVLGQYAGSVDAQFALPVPVSGDANPGFFRSALGHPVRVPATLHPEGSEVLVEARPVGAASGEVAFDRVLLRQSEDLPLYLPRGKFKFSSFTTDGRRLAEIVVRSP